MRQYLPFLLSLLMVACRDLPGGVGLTPVGDPNLDPTSHEQAGGEDSGKDPQDPSQEPSAHPPGGTEWIVYSSGKSIRALRADGTGERIIVDMTPEAAFETLVLLPELSPEGAKIALTLYKTGGTPYLFITDFEPEQTLQIDVAMLPGYFDAKGMVQGWDPAWSPDGKKLAFQSGSGLSVMDAKGQNVKHLAANVAMVDPRWSPDGQKLAFTSWSEGGNRYDVCVIDAAGTGLTNLTSAPLDQTRAHWSPTGEVLAYRLWDTESASSSLHLMKPDGSQSQRVTASDFEYVGKFMSWSPDGKRLAFVGRKSGERNMLFLREPDGTLRPLLTAAPKANGIELNSYRDLVWLPSGEQIAFMAQQGALEAFFVVPAGGGEARMLSSKYASGFFVNDEASLLSVARRP